jgi:TolB-like protein
VEIDVSLILKARADTTDRRLVDLCRAYAGDLLFGLDEGGEEYTRWLWSRRALLREQFVAVVAANLEPSIGVLDGEEVVFAARRLNEADQYQEAGYRALMRVHAARGEFESAFRVHRRLSDLLRENNGRPSAETATLLAEITARARPGAAPEENAGAQDRAPQMPALGRSLQLPRLSLAFPGLAELSGPERDWAEALIDDAAIQLWRTRSFVLTRASELRTRPIDLLDRTRREPSDYVLDCRIAVRDGRRFLTASLIGAATSEIMWIYRFEIGEWLGRAVRELVANCVHHIEQAELNALAAGPERATAYRLTLQGNRLLRSIDLPSIRRARHIFKAALAVDPEHAPTLAAISKAYRLEWLRLARADDKELDLAIDFARQSIAASPDGAHGLHQFGICNIYRKNHELGLDTLGRSERHFPFEDELIADHADALIISGMANEGLSKIAPLLEDRVLPSDQVLWIAASGQYLAGRYSEALATL